MNADAVSLRRGEAADARVSWERTGSQISRRMTEKGQREKMEGEEGNWKWKGGRAVSGAWRGFICGWVRQERRVAQGAVGLGAVDGGPGWTDGRVHTEHGEGVRSRGRAAEDGVVSPKGGGAIGESKGTGIGNGTQVG